MKRQSSWRFSPVPKSEAILNGLPEKYLLVPVVAGKRRGYALYKRDRY